MNFVRACDERDANYLENLLAVTKAELELVNEFGIENTFLLQYDALCDERYVSLFKENATDKTELGLWMEIVKPQTDACGLPYESQNGWKWDWHILPGLPMGYSPEQRGLLADEAMRKFKEVFGYFPKTVGGWLIDTVTARYLSENYDIDAFCICRDQINTDAYTLVGGYFNGAYYPSVNNIFTPAQSAAMQMKTPVFRLLTPCPIHNYDGNKLLPARSKKEFGNVFTMEPVWEMGKDENCVDWLLKTYFDNENLGFSAIQIGQENSFTDIDFLPALRMQLEKAKQYEQAGKAVFMKYGDTGRYFKQTYPATPATAVSALDSWTTADLQSVYYDCKNYAANIFRNGKEVFIRAFYLFDETREDYYLHSPCTRFDAVYENVPLVDTVLWQKGKSDRIGLVVDTAGIAFRAQKTGAHELTVCWGDKSVVFCETGISINNCSPVFFFPGNPTGALDNIDGFWRYECGGRFYHLAVEYGVAEQTNYGFRIFGDKIKLKPAIG